MIDFPTKCACILKHHVNCGEPFTTEEKACFLNLEFSWLVIMHDRILLCSKKFLSQFRSYIFAYSPGLALRNFHISQELKRDVGGQRLCNHQSKVKSFLKTFVGVKPSVKWIFENSSTSMIGMSILKWFYRKVTLMDV